MVRYIDIVCVSLCIFDLSLAREYAYGSYIIMCILNEMFGERQREQARSPHDALQQINKICLYVSKHIWFHGNAHCASNLEFCAFIKFDPLR